MYLGQVRPTATVPRGVGVFSAPRHKREAIHMPSRPEGGNDESERERRDRASVWNARGDFKAIRRLDLYFVAGDAIVRPLGQVFTRPTARSAARTHARPMHAGGAAGGTLHSRGALPRTHSTGPQRVLGESPVCPDCRKRIPTALDPTRAEASAPSDLWRL